MTDFRDRARRYHGAIHDALIKEWDPIGVGGEPEAQDEYDGYVPRARGIFDDDGRLMVLVNWNTDLGDAWEWADHPEYPLKFSTYAFEIGINFVIYAMTH